MHPFPTATSIAELTVFPEIAILLIVLKLLVWYFSDVFRDIPVDLAADDEGYVKAVTEFKKILVIENCIGGNPYWYVGIVVVTDESHQRGDNACNMISVIAVCLSLSEDRVHDHAIPEDLQRLKTFHPFVGWRHSFALVRVVIVHYHCVDAKPDFFWLLNAQTPQEHCPPDTAEQPDAHNGYGTEKALDRMG